MRPGCAQSAGARVGGAVLALLLAVAGCAVGRGVAPAATTRAVRVDAVALTVADADRSAAFFGDVLGFERTGADVLTGPAWDALLGVDGVDARVVHLRLGVETLDLIEFRHPPGRPVPADARSNDRTFQHVAIVVADMDAAYARLVARGVRGISPGPQTLPASTVAAAGIRAYYFRDPDGHALELIHFPPGKGDRRWQQVSGRLFLGIDHTAIGVGDTATSLAFYRDGLGLRVAGGSFNEGAEQEALTGVPGARVRITTLRAPGGGPGIELLDYEAPTDGRAFPADARPNDLVHWHPTVVVGDAGAAAAALSASHATATVALPVPGLGVAHAVLVRDPDRHAVEIVSP